MIDNQILYDVFKDIVGRMKIPGYDTINFEGGRSYNIVKSLIEKDNAPTLQSLKYPLVAVLMPIAENNGTGFQVIRVNRIVIAHLTNQDLGVDQRYEADEVFKTVLYPCYRELLNRIAWSTATSIGDPWAIPHTKFDNPSRQPVGQGLQDYVDTIEISNMELILHQIKTCK
jgi:hypothetical protein